jgi:hypothetical protein
MLSRPEVLELLKAKTDESDLDSLTDDALCAKLTDSIVDEMVNASQPE